MRPYYTKANLYKEIDCFKKASHIEKQYYPLNIIEMCMSTPSLKVGFMKFRTVGLNGMVNLGQHPEPDVILINSSMGPPKQNFVCAHELFHTVLHRDVSAQSFSCFEEVKPEQDAAIEWQANESAAELLLPMKYLLPLVKRKMPYLKTSEDFFNFKYEIAESFRTTETVVTNRLDDLKYEIYQYNSGVPLNKIEILSRHQQQNQHICVQSLNDMQYAADSSIDCWA